MKLYELENEKNGDHIDGYQNRMEAIKYLINEYDMVTIETRIVGPYDGETFRTTYCTCQNDYEDEVEYNITCYDSKTGALVTWNNELND